MGARQIMAGDEVRRVLVRLGHEIVEKHGGTADLALVGIERRGPQLAERIADAIEARTGERVPVAALDARPYRDDLAEPIGGDGARVIADGPARPFDPAVTTVVLVDDVLFTGRTARAAMAALVAQGRPAAVRLAVLVDRGHRELPIRADFVGKNVPTARDERIEIRLGAQPEADDVVVRQAPARAATG